ncbi:MAG: hypothetical protein V1846_04515 [Candidatus Komeilibacteria bacterium]
MSVEIPDPNNELAFGPGDRVEDFDFHPDHEGKYDFAEALELSEDFVDLCLVFREQDTIKSASGSDVSVDDTVRLLEQIAAKAKEEISVRNEQELHALILQLPNVVGLFDKVIKLLNPEGKN